MLTVLEARKDVEEAQAKFAAEIRALATTTIAVKIGYQSGSVPADAMWLSSLGIWTFLGFPPKEKSAGKRYWNVFGIGKPAGLVSITCEINSPFQGINRRVAGAFARDDDKHVVVLHRGRVNTPGLSMSFFHQHYHGSWAPANDGDIQTDFIPVATIGSSDFGQRLLYFVKEVDRIKQLVRKQPW